MIHIVGHASLRDGGSCGLWGVFSISRLQIYKISLSLTALERLQQQTGDKQTVQPSSCGAQQWRRGLDSQEVMPRSLADRSWTGQKRAGRRLRN